MPPSAKSKPGPKPDLERRPAGRASARPKPYHHGDLRRGLIDAALELVKEAGPGGGSVREAARRAGVSRGAPLRHFESRDALMTAGAQGARRRFRARFDTALAATPPGDPP